ncbi:hypothetical protein Tdes44962_MAKER04694 [Teratosphaeria destructans]|uniref:Uncharacterized protein n=1 Tax=Teratosphaeria destructans TaxID=418781 RepID=A0A9W7SLL1_9PEZI|nr:hypothetical protein Tdes44962_MAKER04694 [Teratosphaeria destructans]
MAVELTVFVDLGEVLLDGLAGHVVVDKTGDFIPGDQDVVLDSDMVDAEEDELIEIGWKKSA